MEIYAHIMQRQIEAGEEWRLRTGQNRRRRRGSMIHVCSPRIKHIEHDVAWRAFSTRSCAIHGVGEHWPWQGICRNAASATTAPDVYSFRITTPSQLLEMLPQERAATEAHIPLQSMTLTDRNNIIVQADNPAPSTKLLGCASDPWSRESLQGNGARYDR